MNVQDDIHEVIVILHQFNNGKIFREQVVQTMIMFLLYLELPIDGLDVIVYYEQLVSESGRMIYMFEIVIIILELQQQ
jgi:hypothetical protein